MERNDKKKTGFTKTYVQFNRKEKGLRSRTYNERLALRSDQREGVRIRKEQRKRDKNDEN